MLAMVLAATLHAPSVRAASATPRPLEIVVARDGETSVETVLVPAASTTPTTVVIPIAGALAPDQVRLSAPEAVVHLDAYTAPRLVRYNDGNPCSPPVDFQFRVAPPPPFRNGAAVASAAIARSAGAAEVGTPAPASAFHVVRLGAHGDLERWLASEGRTTPARERARLERLAARGGSLVVLAPASGTASASTPGPAIRAVTVTHGSRELWLPFRLAATSSEVDPDAEQLLLHVLTRTGRAEIAGRASAVVASGSSLPAFVQRDYEQFYAAAFRHASSRGERGAAWLEYAGDTGYCDPCVADPLPVDELRALGAAWAELPRGDSGGHTDVAPEQHRGGARNVFLSRFRIALGSERDGEPMVIGESSAQRGAQVRFVVRYPYAGPTTCAAAGAYREKLARRDADERRALAALTGWSEAEIERVAAEPAPPVAPR